MAGPKRHLRTWVLIGGGALLVVGLAVTLVFTFGCADDPRQELTTLMTAPAQELGPVDMQLVLDLEASVSAFFAVALDDGEVRRIGSMNQWHYQDYKVIANAFGRTFKGRITLENAISPGGVAQVTPDMLRINKGDRVIALVDYNFGWSRGTEGSLMVVRTLDDTPGNRRKLAGALKALPKAFAAPLPTWAGEGLEAVITPNLLALHTDGAAIEDLRFQGCKSWMYPFADYNVQHRRLDRITIDTRPWSKYATIRYRRAKTPLSFRVAYPNDPKRITVVFPDHERLALFGTQYEEFRKRCLDEMPKNHGGYPNRVRIEIRNGLSVRVGDLATAVLADRELFRKSDEKVEQWESRIIELMKSRPDKFDYGPQPKPGCYDELSRLHGRAGLKLLQRIGAAHDPPAARFAVMDRAEVK